MLLEALSIYALMPLLVGVLLVFTYYLVCCRCPDIASRLPRMFVLFPRWAHRVPVLSSLYPRHVLTMPSLYRRHVLVASLSFVFISILFYFLARTKNRSHSEILNVVNKSSISRAHVINSHIDILILM